MTPVTYRVADGVAHITLDAPESRNALSAALVDELIDAFGRVAADPDARCVILGSSHPSVWCAGGDLAGFTDPSPLVHKHFAAERFSRLIDAMLGLRVPIVCAANGHVLAGGLGVALCCDLIIARDGATFGTPEINVGVFPFMIMALIFRTVGRKAATEMLLLGEPMSADEAKRLGLINRVAAPDDFEDQVATVAAKLAAKSPLLIRMGKEAMRRQLDMSLDDALAFLRTQLTLAQSTNDIHEGVTAFFEKREPVWTGQ